LFIALLRNTPDAGRRAAPDAWNGLAAVSAQHGLSPLVYGILQRTGMLPPEIVAAELRSRYIESAALNMRRWHELGAILRACRFNGLTVAPLKGACLAEAIYGDIALRPMADIDLLVRPEDLGRATGILRGIGYEPERDVEAAAQQAMFQDMPPLVKSGAAPIEVHWTLVTPRCGVKIDGRRLDELWSRTVPAAIAGEPARVLSTEDLLLHLCLHVSVHHRFSGVGLRPFADIAAVSRHHAGTLDWDRVVARANQWGAANGVRITLRLAEDWCGLVVPPCVWAGLDGDEPTPAHLAWAGHKVLEGGSAPLTGEFARFGAGARLGTRVSALLNALFPSRAVMARVYRAPERTWRGLAWYPYRVWDLAVRYSGAMQRLLRQDPRFIDEMRQEARLRDYLGWP
jgi:hypothetical protein